MHTEATQTVLLYSGGMDSYALRRLCQPDLCLYIDCGNSYALSERQRLDSGVTVVAFPLLGQFERDGFIVPLRNLIFTTIAAQYGSVIYLGATAGDRVRDKSFEFAARTSELLTWLWQPDHWTAGKQVRLELPFKAITKRQIVRLWVAAGEDPQELATRSFSCYQPTPDHRPCGVCKACYRKWVAFAGSGADVGYDCAELLRTTILPSILDGSYHRPFEEQDILDALRVAGVYLP